MIGGSQEESAQVVKYINRVWAIVPQACRGQCYPCLNPWQQGDGPVLENMITSPKHKHDPGPPSNQAVISTIQKKGAKNMLLNVRLHDPCLNS